jgi:hypothetical protein
MKMKVYKPYFVLVYCIPRESERSCASGQDARKAGAAERCHCYISRQGLTEPAFDLSAVQNTDE